MINVYICIDYNYENILTYIIMYNFVSFLLLWHSGSPIGKAELLQILSCLWESA